MLMNLEGHVGVCVCACVCVCVCVHVCVCMCVFACVWEKKEGVTAAGEQMVEENLEDVLSMLPFC